MTKHVIILAAGRGSRMGSSLLHKGLLPYRSKAVISYMIEQFPSATFTIAVSHLEDQLRQFLAHAHPQTRVNFVNVGSLSADRAGPGLSLLYCLQQVQAPTLVTVSDSIIDVRDAPTDTNWLGVANVDVAEQASYCNIKVDGSRVTDICDKQMPPDGGYQAWTGTMFIRDWEQAIAGLQDYHLAAGEELQCSAAWTHLMGDLTAVSHAWVDVGTRDRYDHAILADGGVDYSKPDEATYIYADRVVKFFAETVRVARRVVRRQEISSMTVPPISVTRNFVSYPFVHGAPMYEKGTPQLFSAFLQKMYSEYWRNPLPCSVDRKMSIDLFYRNKTITRTQQFLGTSDVDFSSVNGRALLDTWPTLINKLRPEAFDGVTLVPFHGDLQFDNIIVNDEGGFTLIDWRDSFDGDEPYGDVYYELGKLLSGLLVNFDLVRKHGFQMEVDALNSVTISFYTHPNNEAYIDILHDFCDTHGYDWDKVRLCGILNLASMSGLHRGLYPCALYFYSLALFVSDPALTNRFIK